jgi:hypothetical protein
MVEEKNKIFELDFEGGKIRVQPHSVAGQVIFRVVFSDGRPPLVLTRAKGSSLGIHWTSIPEGRFNEAQQVGSLLQEYYK